MAEMCSTDAADKGQAYQRLGYGSYSISADKHVHLWSFSRTNIIILSPLYLFIFYFLLFMVFVAFQRFSVFIDIDTLELNQFHFQSSLLFRDLHVLIYESKRESYL